MNPSGLADASKTMARSLAGTTPGSPFPVTFTVPGAVANLGVFAAIFGNAQFTSGPINPQSFVYLAGQSAPATTSTLSTTTTANVGPVNGNPIPVASITGFPSSGSILIVQGNTTLTVGYTGIDTTNNQFTGTTFPAGSGGIGQNQIVTLANVLAATITVGSTSSFTSSGMLMVEPPAGYTPNQNAVVSYTGTTATSFTGVTGFSGSQQIPGGGAIIQMPEPSAAMSYVLAPYGQNLPLINLFPDGPYSDDNTPVSATLALPDPSTYGILSGVMVISVGSAIALPVAGSTAAPSVGSPTPGTNPNDVFGLFEWGITSSLDFDVSEVDQVGFPFQVTTAGASPPMPADPTLGVGMLQSRDDLFNGFTTFINNLDAGSAATPFLEGAPGNTAAPFAVNTRITAPQDIIGVFQGSPPVASAAVPTGPTTSGPSITAYYAITAVSASGESMASNIVEGVTGAANNQLLVSWQPYPYAASYNVYWSQSADLAGPQLIASQQAATSYTDTSPGSHTGNAVTPPINNYSYDPLNQYLTGAIQGFFDFWRPLYADDPTTTFVLADQATQTTWSGYTQDVVVGSDTYTMLSLTGSAGQWGNQFAGKTLNIYQPLFFDNTGDFSYPPAPSWLTATYSAAESPSSMVFGADGVFGSVIDPASTLDVNDAKNLYNDIVSALNRGIGPRKIDGTWTVLPPTYWASSPLLESADPQTGGVLATGLYRYAITAVAIDGPQLTGAVTGASDTSGTIQITSPNHGLLTGDRVLISGVTGNTNANGTFPVTVANSDLFLIPASGNGAYTGGGNWLQVTETTPSNVIEVQVDDASSAVGLYWTAINPPPPAGPVGAGTAAGFNIYRSQWVSGAWTDLLKITDTPLSNTGGTPLTYYGDYGDSSGTTPPPFVYYGDGTLANFYAAYFSQLDVSINGLGYGYPYADKNGQSTNVQMNLPGPTGLVITLLPWTDAAKISLLGPTPVAVEGAPFPVTVRATGPSSAVDAGYRGTVSFSLSEPATRHATINGMPIQDFAYTFTAADQGVKKFTVMMTAANTQHLTVTDSTTHLSATMTIAVPPR